MKLTEYERKRLHDMAVFAFVEYTNSLNPGEKDDRGYELAAEQGRQLTYVFGDSPCEALPSQIRRAFSLVGDGFTHDHRDFKKHMNARMREEKKANETTATEQITAPDCLQLRSQAHSASGSR